MYVFDNNTLAGEGGGAERSGSYTNPESVDRIIVKIRQAGCRAVQQVHAIVVNKHDAAQYVWLFLLHASHNGFKYRCKRCSPGQQLQYMVADLFALLGLFAHGKVAGSPTLDEYDIGDCDNEATNQQQDQPYHSVILLLPVKTHHLTGTARVRMRLMLTLAR